MATPSQHGERWLAVALVATALAVLLAPLCDGATQLAARDAGRMLYPLKHFVAGEWAAGRIPSWMPWVAMGEPLVGGVVAGVFDPLNVLGVVLPFDWGFKAMHAACYAAAAAGMFLWARNRGGCAAAAAGAALAFVLSGYVTGSADNLVYLRGVAMAPVFLVAFENAVRRGGVARQVLASGAWASILIGGEPQSWLMAFLFGLALSLGDRPAETSRRDVLRRAMCIGVLGVLFCAPVLLPAAIEFPHTDRGLLGAAATKPQWWFAPSRVVELVFPGLLATPAGDGAFNPVYAGLFAAGRSVPWVPSEYLGCVALLVAGYGIREQRGRTALVLALLASWLAAGPVLGASQLGARFPIWRSFQFPEKMMGWVALAVAMLVANGIERLRATPRASLKLSALAGFAALLMVGIVLASGSVASVIPGQAGSALGQNLRRGGVHAAIAFGSMAILLSTLRGHPRARAFGVAALVGVDLLAANALGPALLPARFLAAGGPIAGWIHEHDPAARVSTPFEVAEGEPGSMSAQFHLWSRTLVPLWNVRARIGNMGWYGALANGRYRLLREAGTPEFRYLRAAAVHGAGYVVVPGVLENLRAVGIDPAKVEVVENDPDIPASLVRIPSRPFAYLASRVEKASAEVALRSVLEAGFASSGRTVVEEARSLPADCPEPGTVEGRCTEPTRCELEVTSRCEQLLVVNVVPSPGWTFTVDTQDIEPLHANFLASAVPLSAGRHHVRYAYRTPQLAEGFGLAALGLLAALLVGLRERRRAGADRAVA